MRTFINTNVLLDVLASRQPFYDDSAAVWSLAEEGKIDGQVSAVSFKHLFYLVRKWADGDAARQALVLIRDAFTPVACDALVINQAIDSGLAHFEDAVQYLCAIHAEADCLLTRNPGDFPDEPVVPVLRPDEFLAEMDAD
jgi:predicted nucleic acid-binding protein